MGYDPIEVEQAASRAVRKIQNSGGSGYTKPGEVLTYDGNGETFAYNGYKYATLANRAYDLTKVKSISAVMGGETVNIASDALTVSADANGNDALSVSYNGMTLPGIVSVKTSELNATIVFDGGDAYISRIEFTETIHPIDPKFIPGAVLPVVELSTTVEIGATFTDTENAALNEAFNTKLPFVVRANLSVESILVNDAVSISQNGVYEGIKMFALTFGGTVFQIMEQNGVWKVN